MDKNDVYTFEWDGDDTAGFIAQEINTMNDTISYTGGSTTIDTITITDSNMGVSGISISGAGSAFNWYDSSTASTLNASTIATAKNTIDLDELADIINVVKKRLLILTPSFEMHEKYPMLKQMYDEYKAMEALLSGPDSNE
jgi:hypothetical protein